MNSIKILFVCILIELMYCKMKNTVFIILILALIQGCTGKSKMDVSAEKYPAFDVRNMDTTVNPGDDFFNYTNGAWLKNNPVAADKNAISVFDELKIDVVLAGHDHSYVRSPMKYGKRVKTGEGTTYIVANAGGIKFYPGKARYWQVVNIQTYRQMYLGVTVDPSTLNIRAYDVRNQLLDEVTFRK